MKIIIIGPAFPLRGGIADFNEALAKELKKEGHEVNIVSFYLQYPSFLFPGKTQFAKGEGPADLEIDPLISSVNPVSWWRTAARIKKEKPDYVIIRYWLPFMAPALGTIARLLKKTTRIIAITDNVIPHEKRPGDRLLTGFFIRQCNAFVVMSKSVLNDLKLFIANPIALYSPHPVYDTFGEPVSKAQARKELDLDPAGKYLLFFGFIRDYKGLDLLLEAMADEQVQKHDIKLVVAGEFYKDEEQYLQMIRTLKLSGKVILHTSFIPKEKVKFYFCACDMVVQPYKAATQSGITQIAYHFNKPMLVTDVGGLPEMVPDGKAGYVVAKNPAAIASAIADFYTNNREGAFEKNVREEKEKFSWKYFVREIDSLYHSLVDK